MNFEIDLLQRKIIGWNYLLLTALERWGMPALLVEWLSPVLPLLEVVLLVSVVAAGAAGEERLWRDRPHCRTAWWWVLTAVQAGVALVALRLLYWVYLHPSQDLTALLFRWDYVALVIVGGVVLRRVPLQVRIWTLALLSVALVDHYVGRMRLAVFLLVCLLGFAATRWRVTNRPGVRVVVQGVLLGGLFVWLWLLRSTNPWAALLGWGLYWYAAFRHVSFVVESSRGMSSTLGGYLCYLLFLPNCMGAMEVYNEFHERNLREDLPAQLRRATLMVIRGNALMWVGLMIPMDEERVTSSIGFATMWANLLTLFFRASVGTIGAWELIEGGALFLGIRLRPNFRYVLAATTPSQFWRAWRGTMTNWLIRYVYIPLGGNRRHQTMNILAAFAVSTVWHCLGIPFLRPQSWTPYELVPIITWGAVNFVGVATHARVRRLRPAVQPASRVGAAMLLGCKWSLTMVFGSLTVLLLGFSLGRVERFGHVVRTLLGLEGW